MTGIEEINQLNGYGETMLREVIYKVINATEQVLKNTFNELIFTVSSNVYLPLIPNINAYGSPEVRLQATFSDQSAH